MTTQGKGLETLGTVLAVAGWSFAGLLGLFVLMSIFAGLLSADPGMIFSVLVGGLGGLIAALALAGLGHLLRAVAQLGRNMHKLAAMIQQR